MRRLIIDGEEVYEVDEACLQKKKEQKEYQKTGKSVMRSEKQKGRNRQTERK